MPLVPCIWKRACHDRTISPADSSFKGPKSKSVYPFYDHSSGVHIAGGNFRVIRRLLMQVKRNLEINQMQTITKNVVEAARGESGVWTSIKRCAEASHKPCSLLKNSND